MEQIPVGQFTFHITMSTLFNLIAKYVMLQKMLNYPAEKLATLIFFILPVPITAWFRRYSHAAVSCKDKILSNNLKIIYLCNNNICLIHTTGYQYEMVETSLKNWQQLELNVNTGIKKNVADIKIYSNLFNLHAIPLGVWQTFELLFSHF